MSGDTSGNAPSSSGNGTNAGRPGQNAPGLIRDFVYLNQDRIFSYLSQMDGGLKLLYSKLREDGWSETATTPETTTEVAFTGTASVEGKLLSLAGMTGEVSGEWRHTVGDGGDARTDQERRVTTELFGLHHRAFDLVMERMGQRFSVIRGRIILLDWEWLESKIKDFPDIARAISSISPDKITAPKNTTQTAYLLRSYLKDKLLVILHDTSGRRVTAYLDRRHLMSSTSTFFADYGQTPTIDFTLVGISALPQSGATAGDFSVPHFSVDGQGLADQMAIFASSLGNMRDFFEVKSTEGHFVPLALYTEI